MRFLDKYYCFSFSIIKCSYSEILTELKTTYSSLGNWKIYDDKLDIYNFIPPESINYDGNHFPKFVIWPCLGHPDKTIMFSNYFDGLYTRINCLKKGSSFILYRISDKRIMPNYSMNSFSSFNKGECQRMVQSYYDSSKWVFYEEGITLEFENPDYYKAKLKKERMNKVVILKYLRSIGIDIEIQKFWESDEATYFECIAWR